MAWRNELNKITLPDGRELVAGSFRGVTFRTVGAEIKVGRRNVVNEYPQRDVPYVDDLGRRARRFVVECHVIGENYLVERDALIGAFEAKGPGELIHPRYGSRRVSVDGDVSVKESPEQGGMARISVTFVEDGDNTFPTAARNTVVQVEVAANALDEATEAAFADDFTVAGASVLATQALKGLTATAAALLQTARLVTSTAGLATLVGLVGGFTGNLTGLIRTPVILVQSLRSMYAQLVQALERPVSAFSEWQVVFAGNSRPAAVALAGSTRARSLANDTARADLQRRLALSNQARALTIALGSTALVATADQALALRQALTGQIDAELELNDPPADVARALSALRAAVVRDVTARAELLQQRASYTPQAVLPALVLAHRVYQDATRSDELVARNAVVHPAFVPAATLEILR
ncbi:MAG: hypothetical protein B7Y42_00565 [Polaromonas sp. 28-63-22]|jgi:prophage DNA circulation protein|nr:MAG: hypothetical protein B7Y42_00565 [Polaromonas sp. 28-63-22]